MDFPSFANILDWFGASHELSSILIASAVMTLVVLLAPVLAGLLLYGVERLQIELLGLISRDFAYFFVNFLTFPGTFVHEMSHLCFAVITGAEVDEICMFESDDGRLGHISYCTRGPFPIQMVQHTLSACAPTVVGFTVGYFLLRYIFNSPHSFWEYVGLWYLVISLIDHSTMSDSDLAHYFQGVWIFIPFIYIGLFIWGFATV